jgi:hypothetical protein
VFPFQGPLLSLSFPGIVKLPCSSIQELIHKLSVLFI